MVDLNDSNFNNIIRQIIKKSLFTERQIQIILNHKSLAEYDFGITKGAYFRQVSQSRDKLMGLYYSIVLLRALGVLLPDDVDLISRLAEQVSVIKDSDVFPEQEEQVINVIDKLVRQACGM
jgi:hypothetical protein